MNDDAKKALINYDGPVKSPKVPVLSFRPKGEISFFQHITRPLPVRIVPRFAVSR